MRVLTAWLIVAAFPAAVECERADSARIAAAGGSITEIIYFLGAEDRIVAVDSTSNFPVAAREFPSVGYVRALSAEGLLSLDPTLVLGEDDMGPPETVAMVERAGVTLVRVGEVHKARGIVDKVRCVASVLGLDDRAAELSASELEPAAHVLRKLEEEVTRKPRVAFLLQFRDGAPIGAGAGHIRAGSPRHGGRRTTCWPTSRGGNRCRWRRCPWPLPISS